MEQNAKVIKLKQPNPVFNEDTVLIMNLAQVLLAVVKAHGAKVTLTAVESMIQDAQQALKESRNLPVSKRNKKVSNG